MNYTIQQLTELDTNFILLSDRGRYSNFINKVCRVSLNPKNNKYEIVSITDNDNRCYQTDLHCNVLAYTEKENPEYFL